MSHPHPLYQPFSWHADTYLNKTEQEFADHVLNICLGLKITIDIARQSYMECLVGDPEPLLQAHHADWLLLQAVSAIAMLENEASVIIDARNREKEQK